MTVRNIIAAYDRAVSAQRPLLSLNELAYDNTYSGEGNNPELSLEEFYKYENSYAATAKTFDALTERLPMVGQRWSQHTALTHYYQEIYVGVRKVVDRTAHVFVQPKITHSIDYGVVRWFDVKAQRERDWAVPNFESLGSIGFMYVDPGEFPTSFDGAMLYQFQGILAEVVVLAS